MRRSRIKLARIGFFQSNHIPRELDASRLHAQANSEVRNFLFTRVPDRNQHALNSALPKAARNQDAVVPLQLRLVTVIRCFQSFRFDPIQLQL